MKKRLRAIAEICGPLSTTLTTVESEWREIRTVSNIYTHFNGVRDSDFYLIKVSAEEVTKLTGYPHKHNPRENIVVIHLNIASE